VLRAAGEIETSQENIQDWLELDGDHGFQLLTREEIAVDFIEILVWKRNRIRNWMK
jgi:uncharacterized protein YehS (DUF1456 family)